MQSYVADAALLRALRLTAVLAASTRCRAERQLWVKLSQICARLLPKGCSMFANLTGNVLLPICNARQSVADWPTIVLAVSGWLGREMARQQH